MTSESLPRNQMMSLKEAADWLSMKPDTLRQQAGRGVLRARKVGGRDWIVSPIEVERYSRLHRRPRRKRLTEV